MNNPTNSSHWCISPRSKSSGVEHFHEQGHGAADRPFTFLVSPNRAQVIDAQDGSKAGLCEPGPLTDGFEDGGGHLLGRFKRRLYGFNRAIRAARNPAALGHVGEAAVERAFDVADSPTVQNDGDTGTARVGLRLILVGNHPISPDLLSDGFEGGGGHRSALQRGLDRLDGRVRMAVFSSLRVEEGVAEQFTAVHHGLDYADCLPVPQDTSSAEEGFVGQHFHSPVSGGALPRCDERDIGPMVLSRKRNRTRFVAFSGRVK